MSKIYQSKNNAAVEACFPRSVLCDHVLDEDVILDDGTIHRNIIKGLSMMCRRMKQGRISTYLIPKFFKFLSFFYYVRAMLFHKKIHEGKSTDTLR